MPVKGKMWKRKRWLKNTMWKRKRWLKNTDCVSNNCYTVKHIYQSLVSFSFHFCFHLYFTIYTFFFVILFLTFQASPLVILFLIFLFFPNWQTLIMPTDSEEPNEILTWKKRKEIKWCTPLSLALSLSFSLSLQTKVMFSLLRVGCDYDNAICFKLWKDQLCTDVTAVIWKIFSLVCVKEEILHTSVIGMHILEIEVF